MSDSMPVSNSGSASVPHGTRHGATKVVPGSAATGSAPKKTSGATHMPVSNVGHKSVPLGNTKHGRGEVPGYLK